MPHEEHLHAVRRDCIKSLMLQPNLTERLAGHRICVVGGTGFVGTWIAETIVAINEELGGRIRVDLIGRSASAWEMAHPHLASRDDVSIRSGDVRSPFEISKETTLVLYAAGIADPRVQATDPLSVHETAIQGMAHALAASAQLELLQRFVNVSSGLVLGSKSENQGLKEGDIGSLDFSRLHNVYAESRRCAESLVCLYASQYRIPASTVRAFTLLGPYQALDAPWAANNFIRDALSGNDIRLHCDGATRRSYLYGSDAASWLLRILIDGEDGEVYNLGGAVPISHSKFAEMVSIRTVPAPKIVYRSQPFQTGRRDDFYPDLSKVKLRLGLSQAFEVEEALERTMQWHAHNLGVKRRIREESRT